MVKEADELKVETVGIDEDILKRETAALKTWVYFDSLQEVSLQEEEASQDRAPSFYSD